MRGDFDDLLALARERLTDDERERLAAELRGPSHALRLRDRCQLLRQYRAQWYADKSDRAAADAIGGDLERLRAAGYEHRAAPTFTDRKKGDAFDLLKAGPLLSAERIRQLL